MFENLLGGVSADLTKSFYYYSYTTGFNGHMGRGVQGPGPSELSPYQLVTIQFKVTRYLHSLIFLLPAPRPQHHPIMRRRCTQAIGPERQQAGEPREVYCQHCTWGRRQGTEREAGQDSGSWGTLTLSSQLRVTSRTLAKVLSRPEREAENLHERSILGDLGSWKGRPASLAPAAWSLGTEPLLQRTERTAW